MDLQKTGKFIAEMRKKNGLTQSDLGEALGLSGKAISKWERGINAPDISLLTQLSKILNVSVTEILTGEKVKEKITKNHADKITVSSIYEYNTFFKRKYIRIITILISILILLFSIFSGIYFINNYNRCSVYKLKSGSDIITLEGLIASNQKENSIIITNLKFQNINKGTSIENYIKYVKIDLYVYDYLIYTFNKNYIKEISLSDVLKSLNLSYDEDEELNKYILNDNYLNTIKLIITYESIDNEIKKLIIPIKVEKKFSNNRLFY